MQPPWAFTHQTMERGERAARVLDRTAISARTPTLHLLSSSLIFSHLLSSSLIFSHLLSSSTALSVAAGVRVAQWPRGRALSMRHPAVGHPSDRLVEGDVRVAGWVVYL